MTSVVFRNCLFTGNTAYDGGAVYCRSTSARLEEVTFTGNNAASKGGAICCANVATPIIRDCTFTDNFGANGGCLASLEQSRPWVVDCTFAANDGVQGGCVYTDGGSVQIEHCLFRDNTVTQNGGMGQLRNFQVPSTFDFCTMEHNSADCGGAMNVEGAVVHVRNCTLYGNASTHYGGGVRVWMLSEMCVENTIIAHSTSGQALYADNGSLCALACCDLYGNAGGDWTGPIADQLGTNGNICLDPLFCDSNPLRPYLLSGASPCAPGQTPGCDLIGAWPVGCNTPQSTQSKDPAGPRLRLGRPHPNPFVGRVQVALDVPASMAGRAVRVDVLDASGRRVCTLLDGALDAGLTRIGWDGRDARGRPAPGGVYALGLIGLEGVAPERCILIR